MNSRLLGRFVRTGMQKNKKTLIPFLIAGAMTVMSFYILQSLAYCPYIYADHKEAFYGAQTIAILLGMSSQIVAFFAILFLLYANQFLMKGRKKEMGLYGVLGMSGKNITEILFAETCLHALICMTAGIGVGTFLNKLMFLVLYKVIGQQPVSGLFFSWVAWKNTVILFAIIFAACLIYNIRSIQVGNPITLLQNDKAGEKEPKVKIILFLLGLITLAGGYYLALSAKSVGDALNVLFLSILLVVIATYCLFTAGSIFILKQLKKNPKFYYKTKNFISVSNLMFRMKHNAAGLASICVLSTGVILLLTCGFSLMMLVEKNIDNRFPTDIKVVVSVADEGEGQEDQSKIEQVLEQNQVETSEEIYRQCRRMIVKKRDGGCEAVTDEEEYTAISSMVDTYLLTLSDYNQYAGTNLSLPSNQVLIYSSDRHWKSGEELDFLGQVYQVAGEADYESIFYILDSTMSLFERQILVFPDESQILALMEKSSQEENPENYHVYIGYQLKEEPNAALRETLRQQTADLSGQNLKISFKVEERVFYYNLYGGVFFVGMFLAGLFLMATVMIIYYKQMSEGYEDQKRFKILANVGLTEREAKKSIQTQVMLLFFLPVGAAVLHMIVASTIVRLFLRMMLVVDAFTFNMAIVAVCLIFLAVYALVYKITSKEYYKIVNAG